ncbi:hypothetical protein ABW19_dt0206836 [Dactylella cylindrospora]|nr:hypothetical protein ABW19_dt0206836 [Dactylella cylindrospora]
MPLPPGLYRADHVGSLLRPRGILELRKNISNGTASLSDLKALEDSNIERVVHEQLSAGLRSITDGEFRRAYFHLDFLKNLAGVEVSGSITSPGVHKDGFTPPKLIVTGKLSHPNPIQVDGFTFLEKCIQSDPLFKSTPATSKVCIPSPTMCHFRGGRESIDKIAYPRLDPEFFDDVAKAYQDEIEDLYKAGCRFLQLDDTNLAYLCDPAMRKAAAEERGEDVEALPRRYVQLINKAIEKRPKDMTLGIHLCRGNYRSQWFASGGYEPVAEVLFKELNVDVYFLEYDDARSGDFKPLRHLPEGKFVVMGLMSSKKAELGAEEAIVKRLGEAAEHVPKGLEQLCLSHQCGFSSTMEGNELTEEQQWAKIRQLIDIAKKVWGSDISQ